MRTWKKFVRLPNMPAVHVSSDHVALPVKDAHDITWIGYGIDAHKEGEA